MQENKLDQLKKKFWQDYVRASAIYKTDMLQECHLLKSNVTDIKIIQNYMDDAIHYARIDVLEQLFNELQGMRKGIYSKISTIANTDKLPARYFIQDIEYLKNKYLGAKQ